MQNIQRQTYDSTGLNSHKQNLGEAIKAFDKAKMATTQAEFLTYIYEGIADVIAVKSIVETGRANKFK